MKILARKQLAAGIALLVTLALPLAAAAEVPPDYANATLSGDWGDARGAAWHSGWAWDAALKVDTLSNRGGTASGSRSMSNVDLRFKADLGRIAGWKGATAYLHVLDNRGAGINARQTGSLMGVSNIEVPVATARIFHAWLQQNFLDDRVSLLAGLYPMDAEFFAMESAGLLLHPSFGTPADLALTRGPSIFNNSAFGLRGKWLSADRTVYAMGALLDGIPNDPARPKRTAIRFANGDGAFVIAELGWMPDELGHLFEPNEPVHGLPTPTLVSHAKYSGVSKYAIGLWRYGNRVPDQLDVDANSEPLQRRSQGAYLLAERTLLALGDAGRDIAAFARYSLSDGNSTAIDRVWNLGLRLRGPSASRPDDAVVIGWTHARLANKWRSAQATAGTSTAPGEEAFEVTWRAMLNPWLALQPTLQSIRHPGGANSPRATVLGLRLELTL
ncbi:MAG: carbohydrate porin [Sulfuritalea sp.]|nr:carbohydrate porin [Sulfuritalea sp.]